MTQPTKLPATELPANSTEGFCPACGEPTKDGKIKHDPSCPYSGDDRRPGEIC